jgi:hypothetical protein
MHLELRLCMKKYLSLYLYIERDRFKGIPVGFVCGGGAGKEPLGARTNEIGFVLVWCQALNKVSLETPRRKEGRNIRRILGDAQSAHPHNIVTCVDEVQVPSIIFMRSCSLESKR